jgi:hypothetical protein
MGSITNLRTARKQRARAEARRRVQEAPAAAPIPADEAERLRREAERAARVHEGHRRDGAGPET